jgi:hypothetical protein
MQKMIQTYVTRCVNTVGQCTNSLIGLLDQWAVSALGSILTRISDVVCHSLLVLLVISLGLVDYTLNLFLGQTIHRLSAS